jgi:hypothetical protein
LNEEKCRICLLQAGFLKKLVRNLTERDNCVSLCLETLEKILKFKEKAVKTVIQAEALPTFTVLLNNPDATTRSLVCRCISHITATNSKRIQLVIDCGLMERVIFVMHNDEKQSLREVSFDILLNCVCTGMTSEQFRWFLERQSIVATVKCFSF